MQQWVTTGRDVGKLRQKRVLNRERAQLCYVRTFGMLLLMVGMYVYVFHSTLRHSRLETLHHSHHPPCYGHDKSTSTSLVHTSLKKFLLQEDLCHTYSGTYHTYLRTSHVRSHI